CELLCVSEERVFNELLAQPGFSRGLLRLMSNRLRVTLDRQAAWAQVRKELQLARGIQSRMLAPTGRRFPEAPENDCAPSQGTAARRLGGGHGAGRGGGGRLLRRLLPRRAPALLRGRRRGWQGDGRRALHGQEPRAAARRGAAAAPAARAAGARERRARAGQRP